MSSGDRPEDGDLGGAIRQGREVYHPTLARSMNGDQAGTYKGVGSPSPPPSSVPNGGPPPLRPGDSRQAPPPAQGEDLSFDARVAAEFFRRKDARFSRRGSSPPDSTSGGGGGTQGAAPPPRAFESDVERAMRELEVEAGLAKSANSRLRGSSPTSPTSQSRPPPPLPPPPPPPPPDLSDSLAAGDGGSSLLSQMDMRRVSSGGGKGRPGGLRDMWDSGGGSGGHSTLPGAEQQRWRPGGGSPAQQMQRHGPGLKGMWGGGQPEESARPKRQGPGLRGLWTGPDMAAADAARSESQAAYMSALNRDAQEKRAFSDDPRGQQQQQQQQQQRQQQQHRQQARTRQDGEYSPYSVSGGGSDSAASGHGTSLAGIGTPRGGMTMTPRQQRREFSEGVDGGDSLDRAVDRAKKAAYADELRKQMADKEARMAMDGSYSTSGRRRASTGGRRVGGSGSGSGDSYNHGPPTPASYGRESYPGQSVVDHNGGSPFDTADRVHDRWPSAESPTPPPGSGGSGNASPGGARAGDGHVTAARRRLVEDVYGGGGMGAALGGAGYRRASTGSHGVRSVSAGYSSATRPEQVGGGVRGESAAFEGADGGVASQGSSSSYLRTGAGVQNLRESERSDSKLQKRAAALEQQRALEEQIAAKARAKREEEDERKRQEEEEARQQQEQQRRHEADAEEGRRRKQAEQQQQLEGLYRQQEEALRRKRGGGGGGGRRQPGDGEVSQNSRAPAYGGGTPALDHSHEPAAAGYPSAGDIGFDGGLRQSQAPHQQRRATGFAPTPDRVVDLGDVRGGAELETPRRRSNVPDVDDLPAGAQARAQVLRSSPPVRNGGGGGGGEAFTPRTGSASSTRRGNASPGAPAASGRFRGGGPGLQGTGAPAAEEARGGTSAAAAALGGGAGGGGAPPSGPPLQTRSLLVPVSSATLFPPFPAVAAADDAGVAALPRDDDHRPIRQQSFAASGAGAGAGAGAGGELGGPVGSSVSREKSSAADPPQDEMDAFVTKWQDEHLRRRGYPGGRHRHDGGGGMPDANERAPSSSPGGRTVCTSPPRSLLGSSSRFAGYANGGGGGGGARGSAIPGEGKAGELRDLGESLAATSRMVNPPSLPRPPPPSSYRAGSAAAGDGRQGQRPSRGFGGGGGGGGIEGEAQGAANPSEQSLTSDSILFYLSGQQRKSMAAEATGASSPSPMAAAGRFSAANGSVLKNRGSGISTSRSGGPPRDHSEVHIGGERGYGWESDGGSGAGDLRGVKASHPQLEGSVHRRGKGGGDQGGQMSPLTRLLAETPVRLRAPGDDLRPTAPSFESNPQAPRLATGDDTVRTRRTRPGASAPAGGSPEATSGSVAAGAARRARALWGVPSGGAAAAGGGVAIAEALAARRGKPWEEIPSSSGAPLH